MNEELPPITGKLSIEIDPMEVLRKLAMNPDTRLRDLFRIRNPNFVSGKDVLDWTYGDLPSARVFDGNDQEWKMVQWVNLRTGWLCYSVPNEQGYAQASPSGTIISKTVQVPLPIRVVFSEEEYTTE